MSPQPVPEFPVGDLQFQKAEFQDARPKCVLCASPIEVTYFHLAGQRICPDCADRVASGQQRPRSEWVLRGALYGAGAAVACSIGYAIITWITGLELALVSILAGYLIGRAVRIGSHGLGGRRCQVLAVVLTYLAITIAYVPLIVKHVIQSAKTQQTQKSPAAQGKPAVKAPAASAAPREFHPLNLLLALALVTGFALAAPLIGVATGVSGILGVLIIFFGLSRAWQQTARDQRLLMGPYTVDSGTSGA